MLAVGLILFIAIVGGSLYLVWRSSVRSGIVLPVAIGFGVRVAVMFASDITSRLTGDHGFLYIDDQGYANAGRQLAHLWIHLHPGNPLEPLGILPHGGPLFYQLVAWVFLLTGNSIVAVKFVNVLLGTATVLFAAKLSRYLVGEGTERRAAWVVALAPPIVWWSTTMLREPLAAVLATAALLSAAALPRWRAAVITSVLLLALAFARSTLFAAVALGIFLWAMAAALRWRNAPPLPRFGPVGAVAVTSALATLFLLSGGGSSISNVTALPSSSIASFQSYSKTGVGPGGQQPQSGQTLSGEFDSPLAKTIAHGRPLEYASAAIRFFTSPRPWAFAGLPLDWLQPLFPMMWLWYFLIPTAVAGVWAVRRRHEAILAVVPIAALAGLYAVALDSGVRQRSGIEPLLALLIVAGASSRRFVVVSGSLVFIALAPIVMLDLKEPLTGVPVLAAGVMLLLLGRRMPRNLARPTEGDERLLTRQRETSRTEARVTVHGS